MQNSNGEFKGTTQQAIKDIRSDVKDLKSDGKELRKWLIALSVVTTVAIIERAPDFLKVITSVAQAATGN